VTLQQLADRIGAHLEGDGSVEIVRIAGIEAAGPGEVTFVANAKYAQALSSTRASAVILDRHAPPAPCAVLRVDNPYLAFARAAQALAPPADVHAGVHPSAVVAADAELAEGVAV
jgi:UDP-3-O-[3-hydroxymyristoyl] glucosamine N-acyltransferase